MFEGKSTRFVCVFYRDYAHVSHSRALRLYFLRSQITDWLYKVRKCNKGPLCLNLNLRRWNGRRPKKGLPMIRSPNAPILVIWLMIIECPHWLLVGPLAIDQMITKCPHLGLWLVHWWGKSPEDSQSLSHSCRKHSYSQEQSWLEITQNQRCANLLFLRSFIYKPSSLL